MTEYYFISDLHIGGDEQLQQCDFQEELVAFLKRLETEGGDVELIIVGDTFGLWEHTAAEGIAKFDRLVEAHPWLFEQFRATGERIDITLIPGNHDYELACYPEYVDRLAEYNVTLEQKLRLIREIGDREIWIEHGMQHDANNRLHDFGNPYANPVGYFVVRNIVGAAGRLSGRAHHNWLRDIQSVAPMEEIPRWLFSNYFYREMSPYLRYVLVPLLLLFNLTLFYMAGTLLETFGLLPTSFFLRNDLVRYLGVVGIVLELVIAINTVIIVIGMVVSVPLLVFRRDIRKTVQRFGVLTSSLHVGQGDRPFRTAARTVFDAHPNVAVYVYGHTHRVSLTQWGDRVVVNAGTWLKRLQRVPTWFGRLPSVYYPSFRLSIFHVHDDEGTVVVEYEEMSKSASKELPLLQRLLTRRPPEPKPIPERTEIEAVPVVTED